MLFNPSLNNILLFLLKSVTALLLPITGSRRVGLSFTFLLYSFQLMYVIYSRYYIHYTYIDM
nr:MAG TPA: hypothetical protein [Caudoviricetes sp.]